jgi:hypothetical protein
VFVRVLALAAVWAMFVPNAHAALAGTVRTTFASENGTAATATRNTSVSARSIDAKELYARVTGTASIYDESFAVVCVNENAQQDYRPLSLVRNRVHADTVKLPLHPNTGCSIVAEVSAPDGTWRVELIGVFAGPDAKKHAQASGRTSRPGNQIPDSGTSFKTPDGNIICLISLEYNYVDCAMKSGLNPRPAQLECLTPHSRPNEIGMKDGAAYVSNACSTADLSPFTGLPTAPVVTDGKTFTLGQFSCSSVSNGVTCRNRKGNSFFISRNSWRLGNTQHSAATSPSANQGATSPTVTAAASSRLFKSPSGNIVCSLDIDTLECGIASGLNPQPDPPCGGGAAHKVLFTVPNRAPIASTGCEEQPFPLGAAPSAPVLDYGKSWTAGGFSCTSAMSGVTCRSANGHGLFLSRESWRTF